jgi:hypothetical protein
MTTALSAKRKIGAVMGGCRIIMLYLNNDNFRMGKKYEVK